MEQEKLGEVVEKVGEALALGDAESLLFAVHVVLEDEGYHCLARSLSLIHSVAAVQLAAGTFMPVERAIELARNYVGGQQYFGSNKQDRFEDALEAINNRRENFGLVLTGEQANACAHAIAGAYMRARESFKEEEEDVTEVSGGVRQTAG